MRVRIDSALDARRAANAIVDSGSASSMRADDMICADLFITEPEIHQNNAVKLLNSQTQFGIRCEVNLTVKERGDRP